MADTLNGQTNGHAEPPARFIDQATLVPDNPERKKELVNSPEDMRAMEMRKRVSEILNSQALHDKLEEIIDAQSIVLPPARVGFPRADSSQKVATHETFEHLKAGGEDNIVEISSLKSGPHSANLTAIEQISELLLSSSSKTSPKPAGVAANRPVIPISDIRDMNTSVYSKGERLLRCKLASVYRLMDLRGWTSGIYNHITVRVTQENEQFLINPFGLLYSEITAGSLVKIDAECNVIGRGNTVLGVNKAGYVLHAAIHMARPDLHCVVHTHVPSVVAVASMKQGLMMLSQESMLLGGISYHDYNGILVDDAEREEIGRDLGPVNKVMFLRNHGVVVCGRSVEEAWLLTITLVGACENQVRMVSMGLDDVVLPSDESIKRAGDNCKPSDINTNSALNWKFGHLEFEAEMRVLDNMGYRTGYAYKMPTVKSEISD